MPNPNVVVGVPPAAGISFPQSFVPNPGKAISGMAIGSQMAFGLPPVGLAMITGSGYTGPRIDRTRKAAPASAMTQPPQPF